MDYGIVIEKIHQELKAYWGKGKVADYIPALAEVEPKRYGIAIETLDGHSFQVGDADIRFSIQSISKVFALAMVTRHLGDRIWKFVGREPSGNPFNSLVQLEYEHGIPRNPFINAGALVVTDRLMSLYEQPKDAILQFVRSICGNDDIYYDKHIARSEREHADRNMALGYLMKSANLYTFTSSSAASISSNMQNGAGFIFSIANSSAIAVNAFSPPDSNIIF